MTTVAERLGVTRQTVYNGIKSLQTQGAQEISARLAEGARSGRPRTAHSLMARDAALALARVAPQSV